MFLLLPLKFSFCKNSNKYTNFASLPKKKNGKSAKTFTHVFRMTYPALRIQYDAVFNNANRHCVSGKHCLFVLPIRILLQIYSKIRIGGLIG